MEITGVDAHHITNVLRMKTGGEIFVVTADQYLVTAEIEQIKNNSVAVKALSAEKSNFLDIKIILAQGLAKGEKMDFIIQKSVELGATDIVPLALERCVVKLNAEREEKKIARYQKIATAAAMQSQRVMIPTVHNMMNLEQLVNSFTSDLKMVAYEKQQNFSLKKFMREQATIPQSILYVVGAEGGLTMDEVDFLQAHNFAVVSLGDNILRTETASLAGLTIFNYEYGSMGGEKL